MSWDCGEWPGDPNRAVTIGTANASITDVFGDVGAHVVGVKDVKDIVLNIYPNPSKGLFNLSAKANFEVMNIAGKLVLQGNSNSINLTNFAPGMYFAKISTKEGTAIKKLIVK